jgi:hypothetical protein
MYPPYSDTIVADILAAAPSSADKALKLKQQAASVRDIWITIGAVVGFLALVRVVKAASALISTSSVPTSDNEKGATSAAQNQSISLRRIPLSIASAFRVVAFRWTLWFGPGNVYSISEFTFIAGYIALNLMWTFINCKPQQNPLFWLSLKMSPSKKPDDHVLGGQGSTHGILPNRPYRCACGQEQRHFL